MALAKATPSLSIPHGLPLTAKKNGRGKLEELMEEKEALLKENAMLKESVENLNNTLVEKANQMQTLMQRLQVSSALEVSLNNYLVSLENAKENIKKRLADIQEEHAILRGREGFVLETLNIFEQAKKILAALGQPSGKDEKTTEEGGKQKVMKFRDESKEKVKKMSIQKAYQKDEKYEKNKIKSFLYQTHEEDEDMDFNEDINNHENY